MLVIITAKVEGNIVYGTMSKMRRSQKNEFITEHVKHIKRAFPQSKISIKERGMFRTRWYDWEDYYENQD